MKLQDLFPVNLKDYLPSTTKVLAAVMPWFGAKAHKNVSTYYPGAQDYNSQDFSTCHAQIARARAMGVDGFILVYDGRGVQFDAVAMDHLASACEEDGFPYCIMVDAAAINFRPDKTITPQQEYLWIAQSLAAEYLRESVYLKDSSGRPLVLYFGDSAFTPLDWTAILSAYGNTAPALLFRSSNAFARAEAAGGYGWASVTNDQLDPGLGPLFSFNKAAAANPTRLAMYGIYPGFSDANPADPTHSIWDATAPARFTSRRGGLTILDSLAAVPAGAQYAIVATWNDYEEGTAIETSQT